jgi:hypothetical protein
VLEPPRPRSFVAASFSRAVATAHFDSPTDVALLARQPVPVARLFMTFLETSHMSERYREAEAVLIAEPGNLSSRPFGTTEVGLTPSAGRGLPRRATEGGQE